MNQTQIYIISGSKGEGKTKRCIEIVDQLKRKGESIGGIVAPGNWENNLRVGFDLMDVHSNGKIPFAQREAKEGWIKIKTFYFNPKAIEKGKAILRLAVQENDWIVLDEIGKLDIEGNLWGPTFTDLVKIPNMRWILCVRDIFVEEVIANWNFKSVKIIGLTDDFN